MTYEEAKLIVKMHRKVGTASLTEEEKMITKAAWGIVDKHNMESNPSYARKSHEFTTRLKRGL